MQKHRFERTCTVRELIMALRKVANHNALVKIESLRTGAHQDICRVELTEHGDVSFVYLCIGELPAVSLAQRTLEMGA